MMIERVARTIAHTINTRAISDGIVSSDDFTYGLDSGWESWTTEAATIIKAMREPTEEMIEDGAIELDDLSDADFRAVWTYRAMIDAALNRGGSV